MCSVKKGVLENFAIFTEKHLCRSLFLNKLQAQAYNFIKKGPLVQVFSSGFCKIFKNTFITEHFWTSASGYSRTLFHGYLSIILQRCRSSRPEVFCKRGVLRNFTKFTGKHLCQSLFFNKVAGLRPATLLKKTLAQVFSCEYCEIYKNTFLQRTTLMAASDAAGNLNVYSMFQRFSSKYNSGWVCFKHIICFVAIQASLGIFQNPKQILSTKLRPIFSCDIKSTNL